MGFLVRFVGACPAGTCSYIDVDVSGAGTPLVPNKLDPPSPLPHEHAAMWRARELAAMWRARELAAGSGFQACTSRYNTVVVPRENAGPWRVYLLAASQDPDEFILTGHHRITVSPDGRTVLSSKALSKSCIVSKADRKEASPTGLFVTHVLDPEPIETHVFTSLNYQIPLFVGTERGTFKVQGATIQLLDRR
jgi:hypothetical protein